jgi:CheY-like chemotaxis protein
MTVLIADDYPSGRELAVEALRPLGYKLIEAESGQSAVRLAHKEEPDLILLDIRMPAGDGFAALRALREDPLTARICIVAFTACAMRDEKNAAAEAGFDGFIAKPITMAALREEVLRYISRTRAARGQSAATTEKVYQTFACHV